MICLKLYNHGGKVVYPALSSQMTQRFGSIIGVPVGPVGPVEPVGPVGPVAVLTLAQTSSPV